MTIKRLILSVLTVVAILFAGVSLWESWKQPQIKVAWNCTKPTSYSTRLSGSQKIEKLTHQRNTLIGETLRSRDTAVSRSTKSAQRTGES